MMYREVEDGTVNLIPKDTDTEMWVNSKVDNKIGLTIQELIQVCKQKWPELPLDAIKITPVRHHQYDVHNRDRDAEYKYINYFVCEVVEQKEYVSVTSRLKDLKDGLLKDMQAEQDNIANLKKAAEERKEHLDKYQEQLKGIDLAIGVLDK